MDEGGEGRQIYKQALISKATLSIAERATDEERGGDKSRNSKTVRRQKAYKSATYGSHAKGL